MLHSIKNGILCENGGYDLFPVIGGEGAEELPQLVVAENIAAFDHEGGVFEQPFDLTSGKIHMDGIVLSEALGGKWNHFALTGKCVVLVVGNY